jgi:hypothetical protein
MDKLNGKDLKRGIRLECSLLPLLFIIYMNTIIKKMETKVTWFVAINRHFQPDTMPFGDDFVLLATSEDYLYFNRKDKILAFQGKEVKYVQT